MTLSEYLKLIRQDRHLTQEQVATKTGMSVTGYAAIEQNKRSPSLTTAQKICKVLKVSLDTLPTS